MVVPTVLTGSALVGTTRTPTGRDACAPSGTGWIMAINPFSGARLPQNFFDISRDGQFNSDDNTGTGVINSGIRLESPPTKPIFVENNMCVTKDDGTTECMRTKGGATEARRASWREITN
jgi:type IV pilus assembly protein PilY1